MKKALVIGNGESRNRIGLNLFKRNEWEIYGCNGLYRDFNPDHLIIIDEEMRTEFEYNTRTAGRRIMVGKADIGGGYARAKSANLPERRSSIYGKIENVHFVEDMPEYEPMMSAGCMALQIAMRDYCEIDLIGFDLGSKDGLINNIYKNSPSYMSETKLAGGYVVDAFNLKAICNRFNEKYPIGLIRRIADDIPFELDKYMKHVKIEEYVSEVFTNNFQTHIRERNAT